MCRLYSFRHLTKDPSTSLRSEKDARSGYYFEMTSSVDSAIADGGCCWGRCVRMMCKCQSSEVITTATTAITSQPAADTASVLAGPSVDGRLPPSRSTSRKCSQQQQQQQQLQHHRISNASTQQQSSNHHQQHHHSYHNHHRTSNGHVAAKQPHNGQVISKFIYVIVFYLKPVDTFIFIFSINLDTIPKS